MEVSEENKMRRLSITEYTIDTENRLLQEHWRQFFERCISPAELRLEDSAGQHLYYSMSAGKHIRLEIARSAQQALLTIISSDEPESVASTILTDHPELKYKKCSATQKIEINDQFSVFEPADYLREYYSDMIPENQKILSWLHKVYNRLPSMDRMLEIGGGATVYQLISAATKIEHLTFTDLLEPNLNQVRAFDRGEGFNWTPFIQYVLELEGGNNSLEEREQLMRERLIQIEAADMLQLPASFHENYSVVQSSFAMESATGDLEVYLKMLQQTAGCLKPGGYLVMTALGGALCYKSGQAYFPAVPLFQAEIEDYLAQNSLTVLDLERIDADDPKESMYPYMYFVLAQKSK
jgi:hypothetical protein